MKKQTVKYMSLRDKDVMKKQATLFPEKEISLVTELDWIEAEKLAQQIRIAVETHCEVIEIAGSIRRQKNKVHDIDFVAVAKNDSEWQKINEKLRQLKAEPSCAGNSLIKAFLPCRKGLFQVDFYRAKPSTFGIHMVIRTGSAEHNMWLAAYAISRGMRLKYSEGLTKEGCAIAGEDEKGLFMALDLPCPLPSQREIADGKPIWMAT